MKQKYLHILAATAAALSLTACGNEDIGPDALDVAPVFSASIENSISRVIGDQWEGGEEICIVAPNNNIYNACYVVQNAEGELNPKNIENKIFYKTTSNTTKMTFYAYHPYIYIADPATANKTIKFVTNDQTDQKSFDFLHATASGTKDSPNVVFEFKHKMSMVTFAFLNGIEFNVKDIVSYSLENVYVNGSFNITSGTITSTGSKASVEIGVSNVKEGEPVAPLILVPQTVSAVTSQTAVKLNIVDCNNLTYSVNIGFPNERLSAGNNYKFIVTVNKTGMTVNNCTIENWITKEDTGWGTGNAASADDPEETQGN